MKHIPTIVFLLVIVSFGFSQGTRTDTPALCEQGEKAYQAGKFEDALNLFNNCLHENPGYADAYFARALTKERLKDYESALTDVNIFLELRPGETEGLFSRALLRFQLGKYAQAKEDFLLVLKLPSGSTNTIYYQLGAATAGRNQMVTAQGNLKPLLYNYLGMTETKIKNFKVAVQWLDSAIRLDPNNADYYVNRGIAKEGLGDPTVMADYQKALSLNPSHSIALNNIAVLKRMNGEPDAGDPLEQAIDSDSSMLYPYLERAYQRTEGGYYKGALADYNSALKINDTDPEIWFGRGSVREKLNDLKGAYADYTKAIELKENYQQAWLNRANVLSKQGKYAEAIEDYTAILVYSPDYAAAFYNRALAYDKLKRPTDACNDLKKAESLGFAVDDKVKSKLCVP